MKSKTPQIDTEPIGIVIDPDGVYSAKDCLKILRCGRATLTKRMDEGFPLKPLGAGLAIGRDILEWLSSRPAKKQQRGAGSRKSKSAARKADASKTTAAK